MMFLDSKFYIGLVVVALGVSARPVALDSPISHVGNQLGLCYLQSLGRLAVTDVKNTASIRTVGNQARTAKDKWPLPTVDEPVITRRGKLEMIME